MMANGYKSQSHGPLALENPSSSSDFMIAGKTGSASEARPMQARAARKAFQ